MTPVKGCLAIRSRQRKARQYMFPKNDEGSVHTVERWDHPWQYLQPLSGGLVILHIQRYATKRTSILTPYIKQQAVVLVGNIHVLPIRTKC